MTSGKVKFKCRKAFEVGLIDTGGIFERGGLFSLAKTMASVLRKKIECKVETLAEVQKVEGHALKDQNKSELPGGE